MYKYVVAWGFSQAANELIQLIEQYVQTAEYLEKKRRGEIVNNFKIGA